LHITVVSGLAAAPVAAFAQSAPTADRCIVRKEANVPAAMRDGTVLYADGHL